MGGARRLAARDARVADGAGGGVAGAVGGVAAETLLAPDLVVVALDLVVVTPDLLVQTPLGGPGVLLDRPVVTPDFGGVAVDDVGGGGVACGAGVCVPSEVSPRSRRLSSSGWASSG